jgi:transposase-like protein
MIIRNELIDELLAGQDPSLVMRQDGLLGELKKALLNRLMAAEFEHHLALDRASEEGKNHRNGSTQREYGSRVVVGRGCIPHPARRFAADWAEQEPMV